MAEKEEYTAEEKMIEEKVTEILKSSDMDKITEAKVRKLASEQLALDLSQPEYKKFVRQVVNAFIIQQEDDQQPEQVEQDNQQPEQAEQEEEEVPQQRGEESAKEYDHNGDLIICRLSSKRRVSWGEFKGRNYLSIREFYEKDGKELPGTKGITLTAEQWACFKENVPAIEEAIKKISSS